MNMDTKVLNKMRENPIQEHIKWSLTIIKSALFQDTWMVQHM